MESSRVDWIWFTNTSPLGSAWMFLVDFGSCLRLMLMLHQVVINSLFAYKKKGALVVWIGGIVGY